ncbi:sensor histidine kinase, partial [bacterium]|nr:sensor histidine kinase [bacterium]
MSGDTLGDILKSKSREVDPVISEVSIFKQLIKERVHPLDLIRELLSNAGAQQVGATRIDISYTKDKEGHIFEIADNGCGMNYTGNIQLPGRLDKFFGLGLSGIVGLKSDEFSWKGLGSKLSYQSRRVEIETCAGGNHPFWDVRINEPWETIN